MEAGDRRSRGDAARRRPDAAAGEWKLPMSAALPIGIDVAVAVLLLASGGLVLTAALGLARLPDFFQRMHAPALANTLASWCAVLASIVYFSAREGRLSLHVWLIAILLSITAPVTTLLLARAALFRRRQAGDAVPPPLRDRAD